MGWHVFNIMSKYAQNLLYSVKFPSGISCNITEIISPAKGQALIEGLHATYICDIGFKLNGSEVRSCQNATWSSTAPTCESK